MLNKTHKHQLSIFHDLDFAPVDISIWCLIYIRTWLCSILYCIFFPLSLIVNDCFFTAKCALQSISIYFQLLFLNWFYRVGYWVQNIDDSHDTWKYGLLCGFGDFVQICPLLVNVIRFIRTRFYLCLLIQNIYYSDYYFIIMFGIWNYFFIEFSCIHSLFSYW